MNMMTAVGAMIAATARAWMMPALPRMWARYPANQNQARPRPKYGSVAKHRRVAAKTKARKRAKRLNHY